MTKNMHRLLRDIHSKSRKANYRRVVALVAKEVRTMLEPSIGMRMYQSESRLHRQNQRQVNISFIGGVDHDKTVLTAAILMTMGKK